MKKLLLFMLILMLSLCVSCQASSDKTLDNQDDDNSKEQPYWVCFSDPDRTHYEAWSAMGEALIGFPKLDESNYDLHDYVKEDLQGTTHQIEVDGKTYSIPVFNSYLDTKTRIRYTKYLNPYGEEYVDVYQDGEIKQLHVDVQVSKDANTWKTQEELLEKAKAYFEEISKEDVTNYQIESCEVNAEEFARFEFYKLDERIKHLELAEVTLGKDGQFVTYKETCGFGKVITDSSFDYLSLHDALDDLLYKLEERLKEAGMKEIEFSVLQSEMILSPSMSLGICFEISVSMEDESGELICPGVFGVNMYKEALPHEHWFIFSNPRGKTLLFSDETAMGHQVKLYEIKLQHYVSYCHLFRIEVDGEEILSFEIKDNQLQSNRLFPKEQIKSYLDNSDCYAFCFEIPDGNSGERFEYAFVFTADFTKLEYCNCHKVEKMVSDLEIVTFDRDSTLVSPDLSDELRPPR